MKTKFTALLRTAALAALVASIALPSAMADGSKATPTPPPQVEQAPPVPGIDVIVKKKPTGSAKRETSGRDGSYTFTGLEPGTYELRIEGRKPKTVTVGKDGKITGIVTAPVKDPAPPKGATDAGKVYGGTRSNTGGLEYRTANPAAPKATPKPSTNGQGIPLCKRCDHYHSSVWSCPSHPVPGIDTIKK